MCQLALASASRSSVLLEAHASSCALVDRRRHDFLFIADVDDGLFFIDKAMALEAGISREPQVVG
jgi:hypothetical protein